MTSTTGFPGEGGVEVGRRAEGRGVQPFKMEKVILQLLKYVRVRNSNANAFFQLSYLFVFTQTKLLALRLCFKTSGCMLLKADSFTSILLAM